MRQLLLAAAAVLTLGAGAAYAGPNDTNNGTMSDRTAQSGMGSYAQTPSGQAGVSSPVPFPTPGSSWSSPEWSAWNAANRLEAGEGN